MFRNSVLSMFAALSLLSAPSFAAEKAAKSGEPTKEERQMRAERHEKMSEMHEKMAECLRSDKTMSECHEQIQKECSAMREGGHCPMLDEMGMGMGRGKWHHGMVKEKKSDNKKQ